MERFIALAFVGIIYIYLIFKIQYGEIYSLKDIIIIFVVLNLKSSMERFIVAKAKDTLKKYKRFKIQYGEIYSYIKNI